MPASPSPRQPADSLPLFYGFIWRISRASKRAQRERASERASALRIAPHQRECCDARRAWLGRRVGVAALERKKLAANKERK